MALVRRLETLPTGHRSASVIYPYLQYPVTTCRGTGSFDDSHELWRWITQSFRVGEDSRSKLLLDHHTRI